MVVETSQYQFKADRFSSHSQIAVLLRKTALATERAPYAVLDVGCAAGFLRSFLPSPHFYLTGVEQDPVAVAQARVQYDEVYQATLAPDLVLPLQQLPQAIVLADILEHLPDPKRVLTHLLHQYAKPGTQIIISLPNVAHLYVRLSLLLGRFEYTDRGILDRTHLRFFTLRSAKQLCADCGIHLTSVSTTPVPLPLVHPLFDEGQLLFPLHALSASLASIFKGLLAYQFILSGVYAP